MADSPRSASIGNVASSGNGPSRRAIMQGAAWSVPVVAAAIGTPAAASSPDAPVLSLSADCPTLIGSLDSGTLESGALAVLRL